MPKIQNILLCSLLIFPFGCKAKGSASFKVNSDNPEQKSESEMEFASKIRIFRSGDQIKYEGGEIDFETGSFEIKGEETKYIISQLAKLLKEHSDIKVRIEGHTDSRGSTKLNQKLSEDRANTIRTNLILQDIDGGRISVSGFGEVKPTIMEPEECFNKSESKVPIGKLDFCYDVWKVNRRAVFVIVEGGEKFKEIEK